MAARSDRIEFANPRGELLAGRLEVPSGAPRAFAIFAHCFTCSKDVHAAVRISRALCAKGFAVLRFDFTGLGNSEGDFANSDFSSNLGDLLAAAAHLREHFQAPSLLVGHSLGGTAVLRAARHIPEVRAIATIGSPADPTHVRRLLHSDLSQLDAGYAEVDIAGRAFRVSKDFVDDLDEHPLEDSLPLPGVASLILHSPKDELVKLDQATQIFVALRHPKSFVSLDDADHLLTRKSDSEYVAGLLAAWASRYIPEAEELPEGSHGSVQVSTGEIGFRTEVRAGRHAWIADEPTSVGGDDGGPTPYDMLLASLGACTTMTLQMYARRKGWPLARAAVSLEHSRIHAKDCEDCESDEGQVDVIDRTLSLEGELDDAQRARLAEIADRCPVHKTLSSETRIKTELAD